MDPVSAANAVDETQPLLVAGRRGSRASRRSSRAFSQSHNAYDAEAGHRPPRLLSTDGTAGARALSPPSPSSSSSSDHGFDPAGDPSNPREWPAAFQWGIVMLLAAMAFTVTFTCISIVPIASNIVADLERENGGGSRDGNKAATVLLVTIWELGEAAGPLAIAPLSETASWGRYTILNAAQILFIATTLAAALAPSAAFFIAARGLTGLAVATNVLSPAIVGDMFAPAKRGSAMALVQLAPLMGGAIGPAIGGVLADTWGWRMVLWVSLALATSCEVLLLLFFRETYPPAILYRRRKAKEAAAAAAASAASSTTLLNSAAVDEDAVADENEALIAVHGEDASSAAAAAAAANKLADEPLPTSSGLAHVREAVLRPAVVMADSFVLILLSLFGSVVFSYFYAMSVSLPDILELRYGLSASATGSAFLAFSLGSGLSVAICNSSLDRIYVHLAKTRAGDPTGEIGRPEFRLPLSSVCGFVLPFAVAAYGWAAEWLLPLPVLLGTVALLGAALILSFIPLAAYVVDAFGLYAASAMTGLLVTRCLAGTFLPLAVTPLVEAFGYGWGFTVLASACLVLAPIPPLVLRYGHQWRQRSTYTRDQ